MAYPSGFTASEMSLKITGVNAPADLFAPSADERGYSVTAAAFPLFDFDSEERNAGGYTDSTTR